MPREKKKKNDGELEFSEELKDGVEEDGKGKKKRKKKDKDGEGKERKSLSLELGDDVWRLIYVLGGVAIVLICYFVVYQNLTDKNSLLQNEISSLEQQVAVLREMDANKEDNIAKTEEMQKGIREITAAYPADVKEEDIMFFTDSLELSDSVSGLSMAFSPKQLITSTSAAEQGTTDAATGEVTDGTADETTETTADVSAADATTNVASAGGYVLYDTVASLTFTASYDDTKTIVDDILTDDERRSIEQIDLTFDDSTGNLNGTITVNNYSMTGTGNEYKKTPVEEVTIGRDNLFGTVD